MTLVTRVLPPGPLTSLDDYRQAGGGAALDAARRVEPRLVAEITSLVDGNVAVDEGRRAKQPDWTTDEAWSGAYPADRR